MFYDCFTEDKYWSRKAIEIHKTKLESHPDIQDNLSSFDGLFSKQSTRQIAIYEKYLQKFCSNYAMSSFSWRKL